MTAAAVTIHGQCEPVRAGTEVFDPTADSKANLKSRAVCQRSSGSLARHRRIACSSAGGVIGLIELIGASSFSRIADATLNWLFPANAFFPVTISYSTAPR